MYFVQILYIWLRWLIGYDNIKDSLLYMAFTTVWRVSVTSVDIIGKEISNWSIVMICYSDKHRAPRLTTIMKPTNWVSIAINTKYQYFSSQKFPY